jgi:hypothetical protein
MEPNIKWKSINYKASIIKEDYLHGLGVDKDSLGQKKQ